MTLNTTPQLENNLRTTSTLLTPAGRGAVAVIGVIGPQAIQIVDQLFTAANKKSLADQPLQRIVFGTWGTGPAGKKSSEKNHSATGSPTLQAGEELVLCLTNAHPPTLEIHCHGGAAAIAAVLKDLQKLGCETSSWQDSADLNYSKLASPGPVSPSLAFQNNTASQTPIQTSARLELVKATTEKSALILLDQLNGALDQAIQTIQKNSANGKKKTAQQEIQQLLDLAPLGLHLTNPWKIVLAGAPNVGKSSLINALLGYQRAIVFDQPGTTRDIVSANSAIGGWPVTFSDTAGLRHTTDQLEEQGIQKTYQQIVSADLLLVVHDLNQWKPAKNQSENHLKDSFITFANACLKETQQPKNLLSVNASKTGSKPNKPNKPKQREIHLLNKLDLCHENFGYSPELISKLWQETLAKNVSLVGTALSAKTGLGISELLLLIETVLVPRTPHAQEAVPFTAAHVALLNNLLSDLD